MRRLLAALVVLFAVDGAASADNRTDCSVANDPHLGTGICKLIAPGRQVTSKHLAANTDIGTCGQGNHKCALGKILGKYAVRNPYAVSGFAHYSEGDNKRAIADFDKAIELQPDRDDFYLLRGTAYQREGQYDQAIADETKAIRLNAGDETAYFVRGVAYFSKNPDDVRAMADFDKAIEVYPDYAEAYSARALAYERKHDHDRAIADASEAIRLKPDYAQAYAARGSAYASKGDFDRAIPDEREGVRLNPNDILANAKLIADETYWRQSRLSLPPAAASSPAPGAAPARKPVTQGGLDFSKFSVQARRKALVIGNSAYQNVPALNNPANDARLIADALATDGFDVTVMNDLNREGLVNALKEFARKADEADWAVVYFAGHGIEMGGTNYLIPVDAKLVTDRDVDFETVPLGQVMRAIDGAHVLRVVILDACRNNPFAATMKQTSGEARDIARGLARIEPARGTLVVYSAKEGTVATDGAEADSPFATALARHLTEPAVEVDRLFRLVIDDVLDATGNKQEPFVYGSLSGQQNFYFRK